MSLNRSDTCLMDLFLYEDDVNEKFTDFANFDDFPEFDDTLVTKKDELAADGGLKSIIRGRTSYDHDRYWQRQDELEQMMDVVNIKSPKPERKENKKRKSVVFRDPLCDVRLYDKVAAKRQQWGHAKKFCRVKRFCWDNDALTGSKDDLWLLPDEPNREYRQMMLREMEKRRMNRKRRQTGESLAYMGQGLEISENCIEIVVSKMRKMV